jgi:hypothetical protein
VWIRVSSIGRRVTMLFPLIVSMASKFRDAESSLCADVTLTLAGIRDRRSLRGRCFSPSSDFR